MWYALKMKGYAGLTQETETCIMNANYLLGRLRSAEYPCTLNPFSTTVVFKKPPEIVVRKWQLATEKDWAHIVVMQNIDKNKIDLFLSDMLETCALVD